MYLHSWLRTILHNVQMTVDTKKYVKITAVSENFCVSRVTPYSANSSKFFQAG